MAAESLRFSVVARTVAAEARRLGLRPPAFRSPPRLAGATRTIRRCDGTALVAVVIRGRPFADVVADVVEGVIVANGLSGAGAVASRRRLVAAVEAPGPARRPGGVTAGIPTARRGPRPGRQSPDRTLDRL